MRDMAKRLAGEGYSVLVPNPFYRVAKSPVFENASNFNFGDPGQRGKLTPLMGSINAPGAAERDGVLPIAAWMVRAGHAQSSERSAHLQQGRRGSRVGQAAGAVQSRAGLNN
jgi:dienelactone hydrolase